MPFHPGILFSSAVLLFGLAFNIAYYPQVRQMMHSQMAESIPETETQTTTFYPAKSAEPEQTVAKASQVNKPIPPDPTPISRMKAPVEKPKPVKETKPQETAAQPTKPIEPKPVPKIVELKEAIPAEAKSESVISPGKPVEQVEKEASTPTQNVVSARVTPPKKEEKTAPPPQDVFAAFSPIVPSIPQKEVAKTGSPVKPLPELKEDPVRLEKPAPAYAKQVEIAPAAQATKSELVPLESPKAPLPQPVWETIDSALQRPVMYE